MEHKHLIRRTADDREHVILTRIYLPLHCYPPTKAAGLHTESENKEGTIGLREREERARCRLFYTTQQIPHCFPVQSLAGKQSTRVTSNIRSVSVKIKNILNNWKSLQSLQRRKKITKIKPRRHLCSVMNTMKNN